MSNQTVDNHQLHLLQHAILRHELRIDDLLKTIAGLNDVIALLIGTQDNPRKTLNIFKDFLEKHESKIKSDAEWLVDEIEKEQPQKRKTRRGVNQTNESKKKARKNKNV